MTKRKPRNITPLLNLARALREHPKNSRGKNLVSDILVEVAGVSGLVDIPDRSYDAVIGAFQTKLDELNGKSKKPEIPASRNILLDLPASALAGEQEAAQTSESPQVEVKPYDAFGAGEEVAPAKPTDDRDNAEAKAETGGRTYGELELVAGCVLMHPAGGKSEVKKVLGEIASVDRLRYVSPEKYASTYIALVAALAEANKTKFIDSTCLLAQYKANGEVHRCIMHLQNVCWTSAHDNGWHKNSKTGELFTDEELQERFPTLIALCHSELSEALEGHRKNLMDDKLVHRKMAEVELADCVIRCFSTAGLMGFSLAGAISEKLAYNQMRADHKIENRKQEGGKAY